MHDALYTREKSRNQITDLFHWLEPCTCNTHKDNPDDAHIYSNVRILNVIPLRPCYVAAGPTHMLCVYFSTVVVQQEVNDICLLWLWQPPSPASREEIGSWSFVSIPPNLEPSQCECHTSPKCVSLCRPKHKGSIQFQFVLFEILVGAGFVHILVGGSGYVQGFLGLLHVCGTMLANWGVFVCWCRKKYPAASGPPVDRTCAECGSTFKVGTTPATPATPASSYILWCVCVSYIHSRSPLHFSWVVPSGQSPQTTWGLFVVYWRSWRLTNRTTSMLPGSGGYLLSFQRYS